MTDMNKDTIYALLREIKDVAMQASLTGAMRKGSGILIDTYNRCRSTLGEQDPVALDLFPELSRDSAGIDEVGLASALLSRYIKPDKFVKNYSNQEED